LPLTSESYPRPLRKLGSAPPFLYILGSLPREWRTAIAVVGMREPDRASVDATASVVRALATEPACIVVSGLALGIDTAAHESALREGLRTVAVLGHGLDTVYPRENEGLAARILAEGGCLVSEVAVGRKVRRAQLIARDRIQSALSSAVVVMQTDIAGGTMHTARFAVLQGRPLFALEPLDRSSPDWAGNVFLTEPHPLRCSLLPKVRFPKVRTPYARPIPRSDLPGIVGAILASSALDGASARG
jgi:DNA processing protein